MNNVEARQDGVSEAAASHSNVGPPDSSVVWSYRLSKIGRGIGTAIAFTVFGLGGVLLGALANPALILLYRNPARRRYQARKLVSTACRFFTGLMRALQLLSADMRGVPQHTSLSSSLIIANHPSLIDVLFLLGEFPQADCVVKQSLWTNAVLRGVLRAADYIPNLDTASVLDECENRLRAGGHIILFPEGTRTERHAESLTFKRGAAVVAIRAGGRCVPTSIHCSPRTLTKGEPWYRIPKSRPHFSFQFHAPFTAEDVCADLGLSAEQVHERRLSLHINGRLIRTLASSHP